MKRAALAALHFETNLQSLEPGLQSALPMSDKRPPRFGLLDPRPRPESRSNASLKARLKHPAGRPRGPSLSGLGPINSVDMRSLPGERAGDLDLPEPRPTPWWRWWRGNSASAALPAPVAAKLHALAVDVPVILALAPERRPLRLTHLPDNAGRRKLSGRPANHAMRPGAQVRDAVGPEIGLEIGAMPRNGGQEHSFMIHFRFPNSGNFRISDAPRLWRGPGFSALAEFRRRGAP